MAAVAVALLAGCGDDGPNTEATSSSTSVEDTDTVLVYIQPAEFRTDSQDRMTVERLGGTGPVDLSTPDALRVGSPDVSGDGSQVAYLTWADEAQAGDIWVSPLTEIAGAPSRITEPSEDWWCPRWMPDSQHILAFRDGPVAELAVIDSESGDVEVVDSDIGVDEMAYCADPSPSGRDVAVARDTPTSGQNEVWAISIDDGQARRLGALPPGCTINDVAWSPREDLIATDAICESREHSGIWFVGTTGTAPNQLVGDNPVGSPILESLQYWEPTWDPSGDRVFFHRQMTTQFGEEPDPPTIWEAKVPGGRSRQVTQPGTLSPAAGPG